MTDPTLPIDPAANAQASAPESGELGWALTQMTGLVLSRETVDTALELVTRLAGEATACTLGAGIL